MQAFKRMEKAANDDTADNCFGCSKSPVSVMSRSRDHHFIITGDAMISFTRRLTGSLLCLVMSRGKFLPTLSLTDG
jgi:hypothetical protein